MKNINQKSIRNMERYLYDFSPDEALYVAVSYTHLDVYKRQITGFTALSFG